MRKKTRRTSKEALKALLATLHTARRQAEGMNTVTPDIMGDIDQAIRKVKSLIAHDAVAFERLDVLLEKASSVRFA